MKKIVIMLAAFLLLALSAAACDRCPGDQEREFAIGEESGDFDCRENAEWNHDFCKKICPGKESWDPRLIEKLGDSQAAIPCQECIVSEKCEVCQKVFYCDGICDNCKKPCLVYEYCPSCGAKYPTPFADARCDLCGKDSYCMEKCEACEYNHYFNGYCDECASPCLYLRCCFNICDKGDYKPCESCQGQQYADENQSGRCECKNGEASDYAKAQGPVVIEIVPVTQQEIVDAYDGASAKTQLDA